MINPTFEQLEKLNRLDGEICRGLDACKDLNKEIRKGLDFLDEVAARFNAEFNAMQEAR